MIAKILGKIGLPVLVQFIGKALTDMNNDTARRAGSLLGEVDTAIRQQQISLDELREANRHVEKSLEIEAGMDDKTLQTIHQTIREELNSGDRFVRFWRPAFGYSVALAWLLNMFTICFVVLADNPRAPEIITALVETTSLWGIALGVLGISVVKSGQEKVRLPGAAGKILTKL